MTYHEIDPWLADLEACATSGLLLVTLWLALSALRIDGRRK